MLYLNLRHFFPLIAAALAVTTPAIGETHTVTVGDFFFSPQNLSITEDDTVRWVWEAGGHDVAEGDLNTLDSERAFLSGDTTSEAGASYEVRFDRTLINSYLRTGNSYDYVCRPHAGFMSGRVTVTRIAKSLRAELNQWQVIPNTNSSASGTFELTLSADETSLSVSGTHSVSSPTTIILREGAIGSSTGTAFCSISGSSPVNGSCTGLSKAVADGVFSGDTYVEVRSSAFPSGEIRGQIYRVSSETKSVAGRVLDDNNSPILGAVVTDGTRNATSAVTGFFSLSNVPNGAYRIFGTSNGQALVPNDGTNPYLVNGLDVSNRNLTLFVSTTPTPTPTPTSIPSECSNSGGVGVEIASPSEGEILKSFSAKFKATRLVSSSSKIEYSVNGESSKFSENETNVFQGRFGLNSIVAFAVDGSSNRICGAVERLFTIDSALTEENFLAGQKLSERANRASLNAKKLTLLTKAKRIFLSMSKGGDVNPDAPYLTRKRMRKALTLIAEALEDLESKTGTKRLVRYLRGIKQAARPPRNKKHSSLLGRKTM